MAESTLSAEPRTITGKQVKQLRQKGLIPVTLYGREIKAQALQVDVRDLASVLVEAGTNQLVDLKVKGKGGTTTVLIRDVQREVISRGLLHVDLYAVVMSEKVSAELPIVLVNQSPAVGDGLGVLIHEMMTLRVECLPGDLIPVVEIDVSILMNVNDSVTVADLEIGDAIEIMESPDDTIVRIVPLGVEEVVEEEVEEVEEEGEDEGPAAEEPEDGE